MQLKSYQHALLAELYIASIVFALTHAEWLFGPEDNIFMPIGFLSLLVLSVSAMAFLFFYRPLALLVYGDVRAATRFFLGTWASFAGLTILTFIGIYVMGHLT